MEILGSLELIDRYPILGREKMKLVLYSITNIIDEHMDDRGYMIDLFNTWTNEEADLFFNKMLVTINFILSQDPKTIAYTETNGLIFMNYPGVDPSSLGSEDDQFRIWYFIYFHECLHQFWDTFAVRDRIQKEGLEYHHTLLNWASDCVINESILTDFKKHKLMPGGGLITAKVIYDKLKVRYDHKYDTQYSLYVKMLNACKKEGINPDNLSDFDGVLKPKKVEKEKGNSGGSCQLPSPQYDPDFIKGYKDAIKDVVSGKVDPKDWLAKHSKH